MKLVIDLPEETFQSILWHGLELCPRDSDALVRAISSGTLLPKGHGRLIDADSFFTKYETRGYLLEGMGADYFNRVTPTIIEADKEARSD